MSSEILKVGDFSMIWVKDLAFFTSTCWLLLLSLQLSKTLTLESLDYPADCKYIVQIRTLLGDRKLLPSKGVLCSNVIFLG